MAWSPFSGSAIPFGLGLLSVSILAGRSATATAYWSRSLGFESGLDSSFASPVFNGSSRSSCSCRRRGGDPGLPLVSVILVAQSLNGVLLPSSSSSRCCLITPR